MRAVVVEIRDRATFIPALAVELSPWDSSYNYSGDACVYLLRRAGYDARTYPYQIRDPAPPRTVVLLTHLGGGSRAESDPEAWGDRTWATAHRWLIENWYRRDLIRDGAVVDVEHILGEKDIPASSERLDASEDARRLGEP